jgi:hypothetical protein
MILSKPDEEVSQTFSPDAWQTKKRMLGNILNYLHSAY